MSENISSAANFWEGIVSIEEDNPDCFLCNLKASYRKGSFLFCSRHPEGPVRWSRYSFQVRDYPDSVFFDNRTLVAVDFTKPDAPSSPA